MCFHFIYMCILVIYFAIRAYSYLNLQGRNRNIKKKINQNYAEGFALSIDCHQEYPGNDTWHIYADGKAFGIGLRSPMPARVWTAAGEQCGMFSLPIVKLCRRPFGKPLA